MIPRKDLAAHLVAFARESAADVGAPMATALEVMADNADTVAATIGCSVATVLEWCRDQEVNGPLIHPTKRADNRGGKCG